jgi:1-acyl-sn-glycerol-3-phosphate acyltransferase
MDRSQLEMLAEVARTTENPILIYPEGTRGRDASLGPFKKAGLAAILAEKRWNVHLIIVDGLWPAGRFKDLPGSLVGLSGVVEHEGPIPGPEPGEDPEPFIKEIHGRIARRLEAMRAGHAG